MIFKIRICRKINAEGHAVCVIRTCLLFVCRTVILDQIGRKQRSSSLGWSHIEMETRRENRILKH